MLRDLASQEMIAWNMLIVSKFDSSPHPPVSLIPPPSTVSPKSHGFTCGCMLLAWQVYSCFRNLPVFALLFFLLSSFNWSCAYRVDIMLRSQEIYKLITRHIRKHCIVSFGLADGMHPELLYSTQLVPTSFFSLWYNLHSQLHFLRSVNACYHLLNQAFASALPRSPFSSSLIVCTSANDITLSP